MTSFKLPLIGNKCAVNLVSNNLGHFLDLSVKMNTKGPDYVLTKLNKYMDHSVPELNELFMLVNQTAEAYRPPSDINLRQTQDLKIFSSDMAKHFRQTKHVLRSLWKQHVETYEEVQRLQKKWLQREEDIKKFHATIQDKLAKPSYTNEARQQTKDLKKLHSYLHSKKQYKMVERYKEALINETMLRLKLKQVAMEMYDDVKETLKHSIEQGLKILRRVSDPEMNNKLMTYETDHVVDQIMDALCESYHVF